MKRISSAKARQDFAETINRVAYGHERIILRRRGKDLAALIPMEDIDLLGQAEDRLDIAEAEKALARTKARGEKPVPWERAKKMLGL